MSTEFLLNVFSFLSFALWKSQLHCHSCKRTKSKHVFVITSPEEIVPLTERPQKEMTQPRARPKKLLSTFYSQHLLWRMKIFSTREGLFLSIACLWIVILTTVEHIKHTIIPFPALNTFAFLFLWARADALTTAKLETCWQWPVSMTDLCSVINSIISYGVHMAVFFPPLPPFLLLTLQRSGVLYVFCSVSPWVFQFCWHFP